MSPNDVGCDGDGETAAVADLHALITSADWRPQLSNDW
jgi:hypothetical protein